jgi:hypothetical protein
LTQHEQHKLEASLRKVFTKAAFDVAVISARLPRKLPRNHASDEESAFAQQLELMGRISTVLKRGAAPEERGTGQEHRRQERGRGWSIFGAGKQVLGPSKGGTEPDALQPRPFFSNPMHAASTEERNTHHGAADKQASQVSPLPQAQGWKKSIEQSGSII